MECFKGACKRRKESKEKKSKERSGQERKGTKTKGETLLPFYDGLMEFGVFSAVQLIAETEILAGTV